LVGRGRCCESPDIVVVLTVGSGYDEDRVPVTFCCGNASSSDPLRMEVGESGEFQWFGSGIGGYADRC